MGSIHRVVLCVVAFCSLGLTICASPRASASLPKHPEPLSSPPVATAGTYESSDPGLVYAGEWTVDASASLASGGEVHYSAKPGDSVTLELDGDAVTLVTAKGPAEGIASVYLDGVQQPRVDLYSAGTKTWQVHKRYQLPFAGRHRVKVEVNSGRNVNSTGYNVTVDAFIVESSGAPTATPTSTPSVTPIPISTPSPTPTPTAVPTQTAVPTAQVRLEARVSFQRPAGAPSSSKQVPLTAWVYAPGAWSAGRQGALITATATTSSGGVATLPLPGVAPGSYDLQIRGAHTVSRLLTGVSLPAGTTVVQFGTLTEGDANGDDEVNEADFEFAEARFGLRSAETGFDSRADLTGDGLVDVSDFSLMAKNFGAKGPVR